MLVGLGMVSVVAILAAIRSSKAVNKGIVLLVWAVYGAYSLNLGGALL